MSRTSRSQVVDITYDDPRTGERVRERRVQEVPYEEFEEVRNRELALIRRGDSEDNLAVSRPVDQRGQNGYGSEDDGRYYTMRQRRTQYRSAGDMRPARGDEDYYGRQQRSRQEPANNVDYSSDDQSRSRSRRHRHRRDRSSSQRSRSRSDRSDDDELMFYSMKKRRDANFAERNFDSSYDGIIASAAGAALGAITARRFGGDERKGLKMLGGAAVGAIGFNAAENWFRIYTEEREEKEVKKDKRKLARERQGEQGR